MLLLFGFFNIAEPKSDAICVNQIKDVFQISERHFFKKNHEWLDLNAFHGSVEMVIQSCGFSPLSDDVKKFEFLIVNLE